MHRHLSLRGGALTLAPASLVLLAAILMPATARGQSPTSHSGQSARIPLAQAGPSFTVQVVTIDCETTTNADGATVTTSFRASTPGVDVRAVAVGDSTGLPSAIAHSNVMGSTAMRLAAGSYWLFVPLDSSDESGVLADISATTLPDGTEVYGWSTIDVAEDAAASTTSFSVALQRASCPHLLLSSSPVSTGEEDDPAVDARIMAG